MKRVIVESPYAADTDEGIKVNEIYGEFAMRDCLLNNETPYASHLLYTRKYVLDDKNPEERKLGIKAGFYWRDVSEQTNFYIDLGMTKGMIEGLEDCRAKHKVHEVRRLCYSLWEDFVEACVNEGLPKPERSR